MKMIRHTILVTGANGQLGTEMRNLAAEHADWKDVRFIFTDINDVPGADTVKLDITDEEAVLDKVREENVDIIVNCAAYTDVEKAEGNPEIADMLNHLAVAWLADAASVCGATLIQISTDYVFGGDACEPYSETSETNPLGVYGVSKLAGERAVINSGCNYLIFRTAWLYSPYGKNFVKTMRRLTSEKESLNVVFDQTGSPTYARDLAELIFNVIETGQTGRSGIYHFTDEGVCSWYDFAKAICSKSGNVCDIRPCRSSEYPTRAERPHYSVLDKSLVRKTFGITIPYWTDSLDKCLERISSGEGNGNV